jgi:hypothetical protein
MLQVWNGRARTEIERDQTFGRRSVGRTWASAGLRAAKTTSRFATETARLVEITLSMAYMNDVETR